MFPDLIRIGPLDIHTYGLLVALGFASGLWVAARRARREGLTPEQIYDLGMWLILAGMSGAKIFYIVFFNQDFAASWRYEGLRSLRQGFVFYGGFIAALVAVIAYARRKQLPLWKLADVLAPSLALGHALGRLGCLANGCCYGKPCALPWAIHYPPSHAAFGQGVHPTQLYEAAGNILIFVGLSWWYRHKKFDGHIWWLYVLSYGVLRFTVEIWRGDYASRYLNLFSASQLIALVMILIGGGVLVWWEKPRPLPARTA